MVKSNAEMTKRCLSASILGSVFLAGLFYGEALWLVVVLVASSFSLWEFYALVSTQAHVSRGVGFFVSFIFLFMAYRGSPISMMLALLVLSTFLTLFIEIVRRQLTGKSHSILNIGLTLFGVIYIVLPWTFMVILRNQPWGLFLLMTLFFCTWSCDVMAYFVGIKWGRTQLCSEISPKKTWEGFLGGLAGSLFCSGILAFFWEFPPLPLLLLGVLCGTAGQLGDLAESILKREANIKDSGSLIPGHGGMLDRFDSILLNSSLAFLIFEVIWI
jgi:phosphatidate cytidylyltransferase